MEELHIRKAYVSDSEFVFTVKKTAFQEYVEQVWGWDESYQRELHHRRFTTQDLRIIQFCGTDVGFLATSRTRATLKVNQLYILPEYQGRGIGSACMARVLDDASLRQKPVVLQVLKVNTRGIVFYQRLGFTIVGETTTHFLMKTA
ncbi:MAG: GNAT family N-acetyltransferase [Candidatus Poribacteria bacterium]|nr:GNAT family N-acetyltransferase [Candidatus Poribacteria bacterium]